MGKIKEIIDCLVVDILNLRSDLDENRIKDTEFARRFYERMDKAENGILTEIEKVLKESGGWNLSVCEAIVRLKEKGGSG